MHTLFCLPSLRVAWAIALACVWTANPAQAVSFTSPITYPPYIQPGDNSQFGPKDQIVIAWQTDERTPNNNAYVVEVMPTDQEDETVSERQTEHPVGRVVDDYQSADAHLPMSPAAPGARVDYYALFEGLNYDRHYVYSVKGPGLPAAGFQASFHTRKRSGRFSFEVVGDEGLFPADPFKVPFLGDYEARIAHEMYNVHSFSFGEEQLPKADLALNTGDNVYFKGSDGNYRDFWMPVWNNDIDSNETGAPFARHILDYVVAGNHDVGGSNGDFANLLADDSGGRFSGNLDGGDALAYFNNYYLPLNGPTGADMNYVFNGDVRTNNGFYFQYLGQNYNSPAAIEAFRAATAVNTGGGPKRQIDTMGNYSFDYGNAHFVFLDANPHLFNALVSSTPAYLEPQSSFPDYPSILSRWLINDLDATTQTWKIIVFHQPSFSSGNLTVRNNQMRTIAKLLEDHGVNLVYNGHEHNYQRTLPLRALATVAATPSTQGAPAVAIDTVFDGVQKTVPDGVIYIVEGAGGEGNFENDLPGNLGSNFAPGFTADQEETAVGTLMLTPSLTVPLGPASWLDTHLTNVQMAPFLPNAGSGPKITAHFKAKVFSFGDVVVNGNSLTHYQISEPLLSTSSATATNPYPWGTDVNGKRLNDPIAETLVDPTTGAVVSAPAEGTPALLDKFTVTKPDLSSQLSVSLSAPATVLPGAEVDYEILIWNKTDYALNGVQVALSLPNHTTLIDPVGSSLTQQNLTVVKTIGRIEAGMEQQVSIRCVVASDATGDLVSSAVVRSSTGLPLETNSVHTVVKGAQ